MLPAALLLSESPIHALIENRMLSSNDAIEIVQSQKKVDVVEVVGDTVTRMNEDRADREAASKFPSSHQI